MRREVSRSMKLSANWQESKLSDRWGIFACCIVVRGWGNFQLCFSVVSMKLLVDFRVTEMNEFEYILLSITL